MAIRQRRGSIICISLVAAIGVTLIVSCTAIVPSARVEPAQTLAPLTPGTRDIRVSMQSAAEIHNAQPASFILDLATVPNPARLEMLVTGVVSACSLAEDPQGSTALIVNGRNITSFTLGPAGEGRTYRIESDLDPSLLRIGRNTLAFQGSPCSYGKFEQIKINDIVVRAPR